MAVAEQVRQLPPLPGHLLELRAAASNPNVDFAQLVPLLNRDPGMAAELMRFANSARYAVSHRVDTVAEAVLYVGMTNLVAFVMVTFVARALRGAFSALQGLDRYGHHSQEISALCRLLATAGGLNVHAQNSYALIGLLHDIGRLVLAVAARQDTLPLLGADPTAMRAAVMEEQDLHGLDHCQVGARICEKWGFPEVFVRSIRRHHSPLENGQLEQEAAVVFLAHLASVDGLGEEIVAATIPKDAMTVLGLTPGKVIEAGRMNRQP